MSRALVLGGLLLANPAGAQTLPPPIDLQLAPAEHSAFSVQDLRPAAERETRQERVFNLWIVKVGDAMLQPAPAEALRAYLQRAPVPGLEGREIVLETLQVELELQATSVDFRGTPVQGGGVAGNLLGNLIAMALIHGLAAGRTDNIFRFKARGSVGGVLFNAETSRRYSGAGFGADFVDAFTAGLDDVASSIRRAVAPPAVEYPD